MTPRLRGVRRVAVTLVVIGVGLLVSSLAVRSESFTPDCTLPFDSLAVHHPIDDDCGSDGTATTAAQKAQNQAKNNFCAAGKAVRVTYFTFQQMQRAVDRQGIEYGSSNHLPEDRGVLQGIYTTSSGDHVGEGTVVRFAAFLLDAHYSNVSKGETVNCKHGGEENNDIHVSLGTTPDEEDLCNSVTAEVSPHFRPESWEPETLTEFPHHPVRITGQLFFDGSHRPCRDGKGSPRRASVWEIHPVYVIDVCRNTTLADCNVNNESVWVPLGEWRNFSSEPEE